MSAWSDVGKKLVTLGLPALGTMLGGPVGGGVGTAIASLLGVEDKPDQILAAIEKDPNAAIRLKELETQIALAEIDRQKAAYATDAAQAAQAAETIRIEAQSQDEYVRRTRPMILRYMFYLTALEVVAIIAMVIFGTVERIAAARPLLIDLFYATSTLVGAGFTGYTLARTSEKKKALAPDAQGMIQSILSIRKR